MGKKLSLKWVLVASILCSFLISLFKCSQNASVNQDGILYIRTAYAIYHQGMVAGFHLYSWPFFSAIIGYFSYFTGISLVNSAYLICSILQSIVVMGFILLVREFSDNKKILLWAPAVILIFPTFNKYRHFIIRDAGYWAFFMLSLVFYIRYVKYATFRNIVAWAVTLFLATLFRIEAVCFAILLPLVVFFLPIESFSSKLKHSAKIYGFLIVVMLLGALSFYLVKGENIFDVGRLPQLSDTLFHGFRQIKLDYQNLMNGMINQVLTSDSKSMASTLVIFGLAGSWLFVLFSSLGWAFCGFLFYALYYRLLREQQALTRVLWAVVLIYILISAYFIITHYFLVKRYVLGMDFALLVWVPFALNDIWEKWRTKSGPWGKSWVLIIVLLVLAEQFISGTIHFGPSKKYIQQGSLWLTRHMKQSETLCTNEKYILFVVKGVTADFEKYSSFSIEALPNFPANLCNYYAISVGHKQKQEELELQKQFSGYSPKVWVNNHGDKLYVYKLSNRRVD